MNKCIYVICARLEPKVIVNGMSTDDSLSIMVVGDSLQTNKGWPTHRCTKKLSTPLPQMQHSLSPNDGLLSSRTID